MAVIFKAFTIRSRKFPPREGIICRDFQIPFDPEFGMTRHGIPCLGVITKDIEIIHYCKIFLTAHCPVIVPIEGQPDDEYSGQLLLVQQFSGRRSGFWLNDSEEAIVRKISEARTAGGSGSEWWILATGPKDFKLINDEDSI